MLRSFRAALGRFCARRAAAAQRDAPRRALAWLRLGCKVAPGYADTYPALVPDEFVAEALADALAKESGSLVGARILIPNASDARDTLTAGLQKHGASVESIPVYRTVPAKIDLRGLADDIKIGRIDAVTFTSSSTVRYFMDLVGRDAAISGQFVAATIGPITGATARELGLRDVMEAEPHTVPGLVESLVRRFA